MSSLLELLKQKKQQMAAGRKKTAKIPDGNSRWRILPSWRKEGGQFWHDFGAHYIRTPGAEKPVVYVCTEKTFGKPCEVCSTLGAAIKATTDDATLKLLQDARSGGRVLVNAVQLDSEAPGEVVILELPPTLFEQIVNIAQEWEEAGESIFGAGPGKGKDLLVTREGTGKATKYQVQVSPKVTSLSVDVLKKLNNLDEFVAQESDEGRQRALTSVKAAAGLISAPTTAAGIAPSRLAAPAAARTIIEDDVVDVPHREVSAPAPAPAPAPVAAAPAPAPAPAADEGSGDPELDALLKSLG